jgi:hypothetical protein
MFFQEKSGNPGADTLRSDPKKVLTENSTSQKDEIKKVPLSLFSSFVINVETTDQVNIHTSLLHS